MDDPSSRWFPGRVEFSARIAPQQLRRALITASLVLTAISVGVALFVQFAQQRRSGRLGRLLLRLMQNFNAALERSVPTAFTLLLLLGCAALLFAIALVHRRRQLGWVPHWRALAVLFVLFAADEFLGLHEQVAVPIRSMLRHRAGGLFYFAWVVPAVLFVIVAGVALRRFFAELPPTTRRDFLLGVALFVGGAVGLEMIGGVRVSALGATASAARTDLVYAALTNIRQCMEMVGITLFLTAALDHLMVRVATIRVQIDAAQGAMPQPLGDAATDRPARDRRDDRGGRAPAAQRRPSNGPGRRIR